MAKSISAPESQATKTRPRNRTASPTPSRSTLTPRKPSIDAVHAAVERLFPVLNLLRKPQSITGSVQHEAAQPESARSLSPEGVA
jgi:hypothetical protein